MAAAEDGDAGILRDLFEGTGIMGALDHAKIEGANDPEARTADAEAARIAKKAADALRQSRAARQVCLQNHCWHCAAKLLLLLLERMPSFMPHLSAYIGKLRQPPE